MFSIKFGSACIAACVLGGLFASICRADYTEEQGVSLEWLTDSSKAIAVAEPVKDGTYNWGWPMRVVRILKADPRVEIGQVYRVEDKYNRPKPLDRCMIFLREDEEAELVVHETCGRDMHEGYHVSPVIKLYGFDREGRFVRSLDQAIDIVTRRVKRGPNLPEPDYSKAKRFAEPFEGGFYRLAEDDFDSFYYMVLVPADPDFKPIIELQSGLPIGYIDPGTLDKHYPGDRGPISDRPLASTEATATLAEVLRDMAPEMSRRSVVIQSRRAVGDSLSYKEPTERRAFIRSPDGRFMLADVPGKDIYTGLLDSETGETLFSGDIYQFSPHGKYILTRHSASAYGVRRTDDQSLVVKLEPSAPASYLDSSRVQFTVDEQTVFCSSFHSGEESSTLSVYDLDSGKQLSKVVMDRPYFRIRDVYSGSTFLLTYRSDTSGYWLFNWRTGEYVHKIAKEHRLPEVDPHDKVIAYVRSRPSDNALAPDVFTLVVEDLASGEELRTIELPSEPMELRFLSGGQTVMAILELTARQHRRNVALLYGVQPNDMDGETISWTPCPD
jgi:hypothetical protein